MSCNPHPTHEDPFFAQFDDDKEYCAEDRHLMTSTQPEVSLVEAAMVSLTPEPRDPSDMHFRISMLKSIVRFFGYITLPVHLGAAAMILITAEALGVWEEL